MSKSDNQCYCLPLKHMNALKISQVRVRITEEDGVIIESLAADAAMQNIDIASAILHAGVRAIAANNNRLTLPLRFQIVGAAEPAAAVPTRRR